MIKQSKRMGTTHIVLALAATGLLLAGCSKQRHAATVDPALARESLVAALESWKKGEAPGRLRQATPSITVQDLDWKTGYHLVDYQVLGDGKHDDANLLCPVKLTLRDPQGRAVTREVTYMVGTDPSITVFREMKF